MGEAEVVDGDRLEGGQLQPAVGLVAGVVSRRQVVLGQAGPACQQGGPVGLDREQLVRALVGHQELGRVGVGVQRVGGDHRAVDREHLGSPMVAR